MSCRGGVLEDIFWSPWPQSLQVLENALSLVKNSIIFWFVRNGLRSLPFFSWRLFFWERLKFGVSLFFWKTLVRCVLGLKHFCLWLQKGWSLALASILASLTPPPTSVLMLNNFSFKTVLRFATIWLTQYHIPVSYNKWKLKIAWEKRLRLIFYLPSCISMTITS